MNLVEKAIGFATKAHEGQVRKFGNIPYILHPLEVANIIATITPDQETIAAGVLHDTVEDCGVLPETIRKEFGPRVHALVSSETEDKLEDRPPADTWYERKRDSLIMLKLTKDRDAKILWLSDKLSNIRSFGRQYLISGDEMWNALHQNDPRMQKWYYTTILKFLSEFDGTPAYLEYKNYVHFLFNDVEDADVEEI